MPKNCMNTSLKAIYIAGIAFLTCMAFPLWSLNSWENKFANVSEKKVFA